MRKEDHEQYLILKGLSKDPYTAEAMLLDGNYGEPTNEVLRSIFFLKQLAQFEAFGQTANLQLKDE